MTDESAATPESAPDPMLILQLHMDLPADFGDFGIMEKVALPADVIDHMPTLEQWIDQALDTQFRQLAWSMKTTLLGVLRARAVVGHPLTGEEFQAFQLERQRVDAAAMDAALLNANGAPDAEEG